MSFWACADGKEPVDTAASACEAYEGSFPMSSDSGVLSGTLTFPAELEAGLFIEMGVSTETSYYGVMPKIVSAETCGVTKDFFIEDVPMGDFLLLARVQADEQPEGEDAETVYAAEGEVSVSVNEDEQSGIEIVLE